MGLRDQLDIAVVMRVVVRPVLSALLKPGELDSVTLGWTQVHIPVWTEPSTSGRSGIWVQTPTQAEFDNLPRETFVRLVVDLRIKEEPFSYEVADDQETNGVDLEWKESEFYDLLQDFVAESKFGWGELRTGVIDADWKRDPSRTRDI